MLKLQVLHIAGLEEIQSHELSKIGGERCYHRNHTRTGFYSEISRDPLSFDFYYHKSKKECVEF
jgi:hypothetical protein